LELPQLTTYLVDKRDDLSVNDPSRGEERSRVHLVYNEVILSSTFIEIEASRFSIDPPPRTAPNDAKSIEHLPRGTVLDGATEERDVVTLADPLSRDALGVDLGATRLRVVEVSPVQDENAQR
jgi:hypothetical protein